MRHYAKLRPFLSTDEMDESTKMAFDLKEDLQFFDLYIKRNKKSPFDFELSFTKGMCTNFLYDLWKDYYKHFKDDLDELCMEYIIVKKFMETLEGCGGYYSTKELKEIYHYFNDTYSISLKDYVTDFIGCSKHCSDVIVEITSFDVNM